MKKTQSICKIVTQNCDEQVGEKFFFLGWNDIHLLFSKTMTTTHMCDIITTIDWLIKLCAPQFFECIFFFKKCMARLWLFEMGQRWKKIEKTTMNLSHREKRHSQCIVNFTSIEKFHIIIDCISCWVLPGSFWLQNWNVTQLSESEIHSQHYRYEQKFSVDEKLLQNTDIRFEL